MYFLQMGSERNFNAVMRQFKKVNWRQRQAWRWDERAEAFDDALNVNQLGLITEKRLLAARQQVEVGSKMLELAQKALEHYSSGEGIKPVDIPRLAEAGMKLQRIGLGEPTEQAEDTKRNLETFLMDVTKTRKSPRRITD